MGEPKIPKVETLVGNFERKYEMKFSRYLLFATMLSVFALGAPANAQAGADNWTPLVYGADQSPMTIKVGSQNCSQNCHNAWLNCNSQAGQEWSSEKANRRDAYEACEAQYHVCLNRCDR